MLLEIKTVQSGPIKTLIEALKEILTDANIEFNDTGLRIVAMDQSKTVLVHLKLEKDKFDEYKCKQKMVVGVSMINLFKLIKTITNNDTLTLYIDDKDKNKLGIRVENSVKNQVTNYKLNLMDLNEDNITIPAAEFDSVIIMPSTDFQKICRDMNNLSDTIEIMSVGAKLVFSCNGEFACQTTSIGESNNDTGGIDFKKNLDPSKVIQGHYNLKYLNYFTKCTGLCQSIEIHMKNDFPLLITFAVGNLGKLKLALAPKVITQ